MSFPGAEGYTAGTPFRLMSPEGDALYIPLYVRIIHTYVIQCKDWGERADVDSAAGARRSP